MRGAEHSLCTQHLLTCKARHGTSLYYCALRYTPSHCTFIVRCGTICAALYYTILHRFVSYRTILHWFVLYFLILYCGVLYLFCIVVYCILLHSTALQCSVL